MKGVVQFAIIFCGIGFLAAGCPPPGGNRCEDFSQQNKKAECEAVGTCVYFSYNEGVGIKYECLSKVANCEYGSDTIKGAKLQQVCNADTACIYDSAQTKCVVKSAPPPPPPPPPPKFVCRLLTEAEFVAGTSYSSADVLCYDFGAGSNPCTAASTDSVQNYYCKYIVSELACRYSPTGPVSNPDCTTLDETTCATAVPAGHCKWAQSVGKCRLLTEAEFTTADFGTADERCRNAAADQPTCTALSTGPESYYCGWEDTDTYCTFKPASISIDPDCPNLSQAECETAEPVGHCRWDP